MVFKMSVLLEKLNPFVLEIVEKAIKNIGKSVDIPKFDGELAEFNHEFERCWFDILDIWLKYERVFLAEDWSIEELEASEKIFESACKLLESAKKLRHEREIRDWSEV